MRLSEIRDRVMTELTRTVGRWAMVFDNAGNAREIESWIPSGGQGDIIITSVNSVVPGGPRLSSLLVPPMTPTESTDLLAARFGLDREKRDNYQSQLQSLADEMEHWPLALELASAYMNNCGIRIDSVYSYLRAVRSRALSDDDSGPDGLPSDPRSRH